MVFSYHWIDISGEKSEKAQPSSIPPQIQGLTLLTPSLVSISIEPNNSVKNMTIIDNVFINLKNREAFIKRKVYNIFYIWV